MSDYMGDLTTYFSAGNASAAALAASSKSGSGYDLDMSDFLNLMVTELTHQSIDQTADTSDMLNQMVMMQMVSALTNMTDASIMSYAASLVGKTVTVGQYNSDGTLDEIVGEVTGTGTMNGEQVVFVNDKYYYMNEIMAVGVLPESEAAGEAGADKEPVGEEPEVGGDTGVGDNTEIGGDTETGGDTTVGGDTETGGTDTEYDGSSGGDAISGEGGTDTGTDSGEGADGVGGVENQDPEG